MKYKFKSTKIATACVALVAMFIIQSCKKDSDTTGNGNSSGYYLTATVNGESWKANVNSSLKNSPVVAAGTYANGVDVVVLLGIHTVNRDSTAIAVVFPKNSELNQAHSFNAASYSEGIYVSPATPGSTTYDGYTTLPASGGSGTFKITSFDETAMTIEGTFSGVFGNEDGKQAIEITNGKFRCPYTTDTGQLPRSGGLKF